MRLKVTNKGRGRQVFGSDRIFPVNTTVEGMCVTLNTRYDALRFSNVLTLGHFPMTVVLYEYI